jgi:cytochrome c-type biogenesis protein CcmH/NrfG
MPNHLAYRTMLAEATRLQNEGYPRPRSWLALGRAHYALGNPEAALAAYRYFLQTTPDNREAQTMVTLLAGRRG